MNPVTASSLALAAAHGGTRWRIAQALATLALFLMPALVISAPTGLLPFGILLLASSVLAADHLWRSRQQAGSSAGLLIALTLAVLVLGLGSIWHSGEGLRHLDNPSRFLVMPWTLLWVCALRPRAQALWWGSLFGLFATLVLVLYQIGSGYSRAEAWTNSIVLADIALVLMVLLVFCRPAERWSWMLAGLAAGALVILLSGSRGVWPGVLLLLLAMAWSFRRGSTRVRLMGLLGLVLLAVTLLLSVPELRERTRLNELRSDVQRIEHGDVDSSAGARLERLQVAYDTFLEKPWTGVGIGHFDIAMQRLPVCRGEGAAEPRCNLGHAHNDVAEWAATQGLPGLLLLLGVYGLPLWLFARLHRRSGESGFRGPAAAGVMVVLSYVICGLTQSMFAHQLTTSTYVTLVGVLAALSIIDARRHDRAAGDQP